MIPKVRQLLSDMLIKENLDDNDLRARALEILLENERGKSHQFCANGETIQISSDFYLALSEVAKDYKIKAIKMLRGYFLKPINLLTAKLIIEQIMSGKESS